MTADEALTYGFDHIAVATGATWRRDGVGIHHRHPIPDDATVEVLTPDDVMASKVPSGRVMVYDDEHFTMGGLLCELIARNGATVILVTPAAEVSSYTTKTMEQHRVHRRLLELGVTILPHHAVAAISDGEVSLVHTVSGTEAIQAVDSVVFVTGRLPNETLALELLSRSDEWSASGLTSVRAIGDAYAPGQIVNAVWDGRRYAEELDGEDDNAIYRRNIPSIE
jgi:dimethylamine/trimethylamine dehydrogenase